MESSARKELLEVKEFGDITTVRFMDKNIRDEQDIQMIGKQLFSLIDELGQRKILLNLCNVEYFSAAMLGKFITLNRKVKGAGGELIFCNVDPVAHEAFASTKLDRLFMIVKDEQEALAILNPMPG